LSALEVAHGFEGVAGEGGKRSAETDDDQETPAGVGEDTFRGPDHKEAHDDAAHDVDEQRAVGKDGAEFLDRKTAYEVACIGADNRAQGYDKQFVEKGSVHDRVLPTKFVGVISRIHSQPKQAVMANSIAVYLFFTTGGTEKHRGLCTEVISGSKCKEVLLLAFDQEPSQRFKDLCPRAEAFQRSEG